MLATPAHAAGVHFFVDSSYDDTARSDVTATDLLDSNHSHFYVEDSFLDSLSSVGKQQLAGYVASIAKDFDNTLYPNETYVFGNEWKPGIDGDAKVYILLTPMKNSAGGYFRPLDEQPTSQYPGSNQKEILFLNAHLITLPHEHEFLAHEFQHLINYNQKTRIQGIQDEVWLNEMMSETAPMVAGIYKEPSFVYTNSNLYDRVTTFLSSPNDDLLDWQESADDYAQLALLGDYLYEHYGPQLFTDLEEMDKTGVPALDQALQEVGAGKTFEQVFSEWVAAVILNNCSAVPQNLYCYTDSFLGYDNLHIQFHQVQLGSTQVSFDGQRTDEWAGDWFRYSPSQSGGPASYLNFSFSAPATTTKFRGLFIVYHADGTTSVNPINFSQGKATWSVANFGTDVQKVDLTFGDFFHTQTTENNPFSTTFSLDATSSSTPVATSSAALTATDGSLLEDGDVIRAAGDTKVYVVQGVYKRWIQTAAIFNSYGNLHWDAIKEVSADTLAQYQTSSLVQLFGDPRVFIENSDGTKQWIETEQVFIAHGYSWGMIFIINQNEFDLFPTGAPITS